MDNEKRWRATAVQDAAANFDGLGTARSVLECASPLALFSPHPKESAGKYLRCWNSSVIRLIIRHFPDTSFFAAWLGYFPSSILYPRFSAKRLRISARIKPLVCSEVMLELLMTFAPSPIINGAVAR